MQAVPSLAGTGAAVAAAAAGLAFGEPDGFAASVPRSAARRKMTLDYDYRRLSASRPGTSWAANYQSAEDYTIATGARQQPAEAVVASNPPTPTARQPRAADTQTTPPKAPSSRRQSITRRGPPSHAEDARDSVSSSSSWMRRLSISIRPLSQHGSPRSSVLGPDSPSLFSHGSNAPILSPTGSVAPQLPPNKLVKRATSGQDNAGSIARRGTLRRPATSHQRSATLQQLQSPGTLPGQSAPTESLERRSRPRASTTVAADISSTIHEAPGWTSFFHARRFRGTGRGLHSHPTEDGPANNQLPSRRLHIRQSSLARAYLVRPSMVSGEEGASELPTEARPQTALEVAPEAPAETSAEEHGMGPELRASPQSSDKASTSPDGTPKRARRSMSTHFSSPTSWISKTGSVRRVKPSPETKDGSGKRHASAPASSPQHGAQGDAKVAIDGTLISPGQGEQDAGLDVKARLSLGTRRRNFSSPIPPLSRISSFNVDLARLGSPSPTSPGHSQPTQPPHPNAAGPSQPILPMTHARAASAERGSSTFTSSVFDGRDLASGDDDDTDFRSDTVFDSLRTAGSARIRAVETPAESMFDESPPSTAGNGKTKRLSIQEILGRPWDGDTKIEEEDEGMPTPSWRDRSLPGLESSYDDDDDDEERRQLEEAFAGTSRTSNDFGRLSLDTDDDDWARDEETTLSNHLSPPTSSVNSRRGVSPQLRTALASISGNGGTDTPNWDMASDRPRSSIFDWSEPSLHDKVEVNGHWPRPKTVHGKQELDLRGGRAASRKGPMSGHVRSQSVPVVPDPSEVAKAAPKFGTWGLGTKTASEDWDDDFDFEEAGPEEDLGKSVPKTSAMVVPPSIQATQPTVKAHSGQIRELSLLVSSLKRLCRQGRDLDLLDGPAEALWKEADNIIALASPDEDDDGDDEADGDQSSIDFDVSTIDEQFLDEGFDAASLDHVAENYDISFEVSEPNIPKTSVVKERQVVRRRSVFSPEDDIFGGHWPLADENKRPETPRTPERTREFHTPDGTVVASVMEAMQQHRATSNLRRSPVKPSKAKLFFDTNSLQELVKRANTLFHTLSDTVRRAELLTQSPAVTPKHERHRRADGSPAFTRVFTDPAASPPKRLPKSQSTPTVLSRTSIDSPASNGMGQRMQMMTVS